MLNESEWRCEVRRGEEKEYQKCDVTNGPSKQTGAPNERCELLN